MGLFDIFHKKQNEQPITQSGGSDFLKSPIEKEVTKQVSGLMSKAGLIRMPVIMFLKNDHGIFEDIYKAYMADPEMELVKKTRGEYMYLMVLAGHSFGFGVYTAQCQAIKRKRVSQFTDKEVEELEKKLLATDPYGYILQTLGIPLDSDNKRACDTLLGLGVGSYKKAAGSGRLEHSNLKYLMRVMYNAGYSFIMG